MRTGTMITTVLLLAGCGAYQLTPLAVAAREGNTARIGELIRNGADPNGRSGVNEWTPLMHAIHKNQKASVIALAEAGADLNLRGGEMTPLIMAAGYGQTDLVRELLKRGADPHVTGSHGINALTAAVGGAADVDRFTAGTCQTDTVRALLERAPGLRPADNLFTRATMITARLRDCRELRELLNRPAKAK